MRITEIRQLSVNLRGKLRNAVVDFSQHTVSLVALVSDVYRHGQPIIGIAFNSTLMRLSPLSSYWLQHIILYFLFVLFCLSLD